MSSGPSSRKKGRNGKGIMNMQKRKKAKAVPEEKGTPKKREGCGCSKGDCLSCMCSLAFCSKANGCACTSEHCQNRMHLWEIPTLANSGSGGSPASEEHLNDAKKAVTQALKKSSRKITDLLRKLFPGKGYAFDLRKALGFVQGAILKQMEENEFGYNDGEQVSISRERRFNQATLKATLFHEALHNTFKVGRVNGKRGNYLLDRTKDGDAEHYILMLLGDPIELRNWNRDEETKLTRWFKRQ